MFLGLEQMQLTDIYGTLTLFFKAQVFPSAFLTPSKYDFKLVSFDLHKTPSLAKKNQTKQKNLTYVRLITSKELEKKNTQNTQKHQNAIYFLKSHPFSTTR